MVLKRHDTSGKLGTLMRGHWDHFQHLKGQHTAAIACPTCDRLFSLADHTIAADGTAHPSVVCPRGCGFHVFVQLDGWSKIAS